jgi:hypothetical protein
MDTYPRSRKMMVVKRTGTRPQEGLLTQFVGIKKIVLCDKEHPPFGWQLRATDERPWYLSL